MPATSAWRVDGARGVARRSYWGIGRMRDLTGVPLALGALLPRPGHGPGRRRARAGGRGAAAAELWRLLDAHGVRAEAVT